jgi:cytochrome b pre-mRNA-processing protein 3
MLLLHLWLVLRRMSPKDELSQGLFDRFCGDMDDNLRELSTSDMKVPKKMREFGDAFYGRTGAYDAALGAGREPLAAALSKNIYYGMDIENARRLAVYVEAANARLGTLDTTTLTSGAWHFPSPAETLVTT